MALTHFDLFSGIGGFSLAARWAGFETVGFSEIDPFCCKVLEKNFPDVKNYGDIKNIESPQPVDLITGGFPCQPWSVAGSKKGIKDERHLWPEFKRIIRISKPDWVIAENVPGIISYLDIITKDLEKEGYTCWSLLIPASTIGAPHKRERLWIVAYADSIGRNIGQHPGQERYIQDYIKRYTKTLQSKWTRFFYKSWTTFDAQDWLNKSTISSSISRRQKNQPVIPVSFGKEKKAGAKRSALFAENQLNWQEDQPPIPGVDARLPNLVDRNRALGNAIVPQVIYPILEFIKLCHE